MSRSKPDVPHISPDFPISATTYQRQKCRCKGCRADAARQMAETRARKSGRTRLTQLSHQKANAAAARWVKHNQPELWRKLLKEARDEIRAAHPELDVDLRRSA